MMQQLKVILMVGLPGSGKTRVARATVLEQPGRWIRINRDDIRAMLGEPYSKPFEKIVAKLRDVMVIEAVTEGYNVLVDDTNLDLPKKLTHFKALVAGFGETVEVEVIDLTHVSVADCIRHDIERGTKAYAGRMVGEKVIRRMHRDFLAKPVEPPVFDPDKPTCVIFDIDGTLADMAGKRGPYDKDKYLGDEPKQPIVDILTRFDKHSGYKILIVSGREDDGREDTVAWLKMHGIGYDELHMRKAGDHRNDALVKREILEADILPYYNVHCVFDDRDRVVAMWRAHGLTCLQCAEGAF